MERFQDPERLAALFARCRIPERLPWTAAYPWTLQYYEKGEYLCRLREPMESLYLLLEGGIQTSLTNAAGRLYAPTWGFCAMPPGGWPALW